MNTLAGMTGVTAMLALHAAHTPASAALVVGQDRITWRALAAQVERPPRTSPAARNALSLVARRI
jgi:hypothetical protein